MPRYYFHIVREGRLVEDSEGMDLPDITAANSEALASAREMAIEAFGSTRPISDDQNEIRDENGKSVKILTVRSIMD
jgi:hypothetical protein